MEGKLGIKEVKELLAFSVALGNAVGESLEDGKITITDAFKFFPVLRLAQAGIDGFKQVWPELQDMDDEEQAELLAYAEREFDIPQDELESYLEVAFEFGLTLIAVVAKFGKAA